ncbi:hypothetical protein ALC53_09512 [Atta colombica]|uniref:Uncharacterized protein n=1 Tax=Atta colombica TaxID=520822 RepID=A0A195B652_9HYME|nr:hypothetical protein ALC53_09512 [Atta colombica]
MRFTSPSRVDSTTKRERRCHDATSVTRTPPGQWGYLSLIPKSLEGVQQSRRSSPCSFHCAHVGGGLVGAIPPSSLSSSCRLLEGSDNPIIRQPLANILETEFSSPDEGRRPRVRPPLRDVYPTPVARVSTRSRGDAQDEGGESRDGACMRGEMSFPARGNLRLVAIGGSKLAREAVIVEREREREKLREPTLYLRFISGYSKPLRIF